MKQFYNIDEDNVNSFNKLCRTECLLKYSFLEQSNSFLSCVYKSTDSIYSNMPYISITNSYLSDTQNNSVVCINFQGEDFWFDNLIITKPGNIWNDHTESVKYANGILARDPSACSLVIIAKNKTNKKKLIITRCVVTSATASSNLSYTDFKNIVDVMTNQPKKQHENYILCKDRFNSNIPNLNLNNFIPDDSIYYYFPLSISSGTSYYNIIYQAKSAIKITNEIKKKLENLFPNETSVSQPSRIKLPTASRHVYISENPAINNLMEGEAQDGIYISCQPTNQDGVLLEEGVSTAPTGFDYEFNIDDLTGDASKNWLVAAVVGISIMIIILKIAEAVFSGTSKTIQKAFSGS